MAGWSSQELERAWIRNGGPRSTAALAAAIAGAESSFGANPYGDKEGGRYTSFGPWQVHVTAHPQYDPHTLVTNLDYSAKAAIAISEGGKNFQPWTTFKTGAYKQFYGKSGQSGGLGLPGEGAFKALGSGAASVVEAPVEAVKTTFEAGEKAGELASSVGGVFNIIKGWIGEPLTPIKFIGGAVVLYIGVRTLTGGTTASREGSRAAKYAKEIAVTKGL